MILTDPETRDAPTTFYDSLGVQPVVNAATTFTVLGGSVMPPVVIDAMRSAAAAHVDMHELHLAAGEELARLTRNDAAYVTAGCAAGIVLAVLGCRTRGDLTNIARLPDVPDLPDEVIMHAAHRIPYDPAVRLAGARIRQIGDVLQTFEWQLEAAIGQRTAAVLYVAGSHLPPGALPLEDVVRVCRAHGVPVLVDAAAQLPPVSNLWSFTEEFGADLAVFSGGKALRGPQSSGLLVGREELIDAARANGAPHQRFARALKVGKEEVAGLVAAVRRYVALDHAAQRSQWSATVTGWARGLDGVPGVRATVEATNEAGQPVPRVRVDVDRILAPVPAARVVEVLAASRPSVRVLSGGPDRFWIGPDMLADGEAELVESRVLSALQSSASPNPHATDHQERTPMSIQQVTTDQAPAPGGAYSQAIVADGFVWTAGFGPQDPATGAVPDGIGEQTTQVLRNVRAALAASGLDLSDVVKVTAHLQHLERDFAEYDAAYRAAFREPYPARTTVGSDLLGILVEIDVVARVRG